MATRLSNLQLKILAYLQSDPAQSVSALARSVEASRPSVSRSLAALAEAQLVERQGRAITLTQKGRDVRQLMDTVQSRGQRLQDALASYRNSLTAISAGRVADVSGIRELMETVRMPGPEILRAMEGIGTQTTWLSEIGRIVSEAARPTTELRKTFGVMEELRQSISRTFRTDIAIREAIRPIVDAGAFSSLSVLSRSALLPSLSAASMTGLMLANRLSKAIESNRNPAYLQNLGYALRANSVLTSSVGQILTARQANLSNQLAGLVRNLASITPEYQEMIRRHPALRVEMTLAASVATAGYAVTVNRAIAEPNHDQPSVELIVPATAVSVRLDMSLSFLGARLLSARKGAWHAIRSDNPDRVRQAAHSMRELLREVLDELAPDDGFTTDEIERNGHEGKVTRRMRVRQILSGSLAKFAVGLDLALDDAYGILSSTAHGGDDDPELLEGIMTATEGLIAILVRGREAK